MADLNDKQASQSVKVAGADTSGIETNYLDIDVNGAAETTIRDPTSGVGVTTTLVVGKQALDVNVVSLVSNLNANFAFGDVATTATTPVVVRRTAYTEQTTDAQRSVSSSSANDTAAGTGARTIVLTYYTSTGVGPFTETITLNGVANVNTVATNICFIENIKVLTAGSTGSNVGTITLRAAVGGGGVIVGTILPTNNQTFWGHHYIALDKVCNITGMSCGHSGTTVGSGAVFTLGAKPINSPNSIENQVTDFIRLYGQSSTFSRNYTSPIRITGPARLQIYVTPETSVSTIYRSALDFFEP